MKQHPRGGSGLAGSKSEGEEDDQRRGRRAMTDPRFPFFAKEERRRGRQSTIEPPVFSPILSKQEIEKEDIAWGGGKSEVGQI
ncbi:hypothetical protein MRB53_011111 [Persea americana]|uniref:Uncharacterized protein n=1 Tax=Persea americana TaxID=3435 RepID=A0ACC2LU22_PERAE|nr:hypothetical protein MRB53_011111 [Persea americana]